MTRGVGVQGVEQKTEAEEALRFGQSRTSLPYMEPLTT